MARSNNHGWDFVKAGKSYQYKEDWFIAIVTIIEDNSDDKYYDFKVRVEKSNVPPPGEDGVFEVSAIKEMDGIYSGMPQFYESKEYVCKYDWERK